MLYAELGSKFRKEWTILLLGFHIYKKFALSSEMSTLSHWKLSKDCIGTKVGICSSHATLKNARCYVIEYKPYFPSIHSEARNAPLPLQGIWTALLFLAGAAELPNDGLEIPR